MKKLFYLTFLLSLVAVSCSKVANQEEQFVKDFYHHLYYEDISQAEYNQFVRKNMTKECYREYVEESDCDYILQAQDFELFDLDDERSKSSNWKTWQKNDFVCLTDFEQLEGHTLMVKVIKQDGQLKIDKIRNYKLWKEWGDEYLK